MSQLMGNCESLTLYRQPSPYTDASLTSRVDEMPILNKVGFANIANTHLTGKHM